VSKSRPHRLRERVREAQNRPGTYRMLSEGGEIVYVGKSKQVRTRLLSYLRADDGEKAHRILRDTHELAWDYEPSEFAALLRELELIKRHRPRFNVQHKRDGRYSFLKLSPGAAPKLFVVGAVTDDDASYFGPFRGGRRIVEAVRELNDLLGLRDCALGTPMRFADQPDLFAFQATPRCHRADLKLCAAPCAGLCSQAE
jgi:excinuclease ABC subunit C